MSNLDFSGLFGGGAFAIDPTKFNFSAYTPEPKKEVVTDPVAVVSDNSPTPDVEVLEGAGTVAVTQPDPVQQAINELQGKDLSDDFNVNPVASAPTADPIEQATQSVQPASMPSLSGLGGVSGFDVTQSSVDKLLSDSEKQQQVLNPLISDIDNFGLDNFSVQANDGFITKDQFGEIKDLMGSDQFTNILDKYNAGMKDAFGDEYDGSFQGYDDKRAVLDSLGITNNFKVYTDELGSFDFMQYNSESGQFEKIEDKSKEVSMANQVVKGVAESLPIMVATAGLGSALGAATGATGAIGTATTNAVASATIQQLTTGEIDPTKVALAALGGAVEGAEVADAAANSDLAGAFADFGAGSAEYAEALLAANEATATLELLTDISTGIDVVTAIEDRSLGRAFDLTAGLLDSPTLYDTVAGQLSGVIPEDYLDAATNALIRGGSTAVQGGDVSEVFQDAGNEFLINQFTTEEAIQERFGFEGQWAETATRTLSALGTDTLNGENSQDIALNGLQTFLDNAIRLIPEGEDSSSYLAEAERWWHENVEDPLQGWWQEIGDTRRALEQPFRDAYGFVTRIGGAAWEAIDLGVRALPTTQEDWEEAANFASDLIPEIPELPDLPDVPDLPDLPDIPDLPDVPDLPNVDVELTNSISNVDYFYDDSDIVRNPLLSSGNTRIQDLASAIQSAEVGNGQKGRRGALVDDDEDKRIKRSKGVLNLGLEANVS